MNYPLNLDNPQTFNEKLQWMKLYDHQDLYTTLVDKYAVKEYVSERIGKEYIIPTLAVWNTVDEIDISILPNQFVLKTTHDSGSIVICKDKSSFNLKLAQNKLKKSMKRDYYMAGREWPYKNVKRRILAEKYMEDKKTKELRDYKFFCFKGEAKLMFVATDRQNRTEPYFDFFDMDYNHLDMRHGHPNAPSIPDKPYSFELMKHLSSQLTRDLVEARVDFYEVNGKPFFGEITLFHHNGTVNFDPNKWDYILGEWICI